MCAELKRILRHSGTIALGLLVVMVLLVMLFWRFSSPTAASLGLVWGMVIGYAGLFMICSMVLSLIHI